MVLTLVTGSPSARADGPIVLRDATRASGITFRHTDGGSGQNYLVQQVSAGLALFDYDGDGDVDVYFLNGAPLRGTKATHAPRNALYRNDGRWRFTDVTVAAGVGDAGFGLGVAVGDYDGDGDADLYLNNYGPNVMYRNNGDGTFTDVTARCGVANGSRVGAGANFLDVDADGDLDLFVSNYVKFTYKAHDACITDRYPKYTGPVDFPPDADTLFRNNGNGTFTDVSGPSGIGGHAGPGMGTVCADCDDDGDVDILVANDVAANFLFQNDGTGRFEEVGMISGVAFDLSGNRHGSMGVECGDLDNDGRLDFYQTCFSRETATFYRNLGDGFFEDATRLTGAGTGTSPHVTWGVGMADFDNDGHRDLFVACGHLYDDIGRFDDSSSYHVRNVLLRNTGQGRFVNVSDGAGDGLAVKLSSRGAAFDDLDNDGDVDAVVLNSRREPTLLRNDSPPGNHWLQVRLRAKQGNRDGVGARVKITAGDLVLTDEVHSGRGYQSHYGTRLHFGLGRHQHVDRLEVRWLGGGVDVLKNVAVDRLVTVVKGTHAVRE